MYVTCFMLSVVRRSELVELEFTEEEQKRREEVNEAYNQKMTEVEP